MKVKVLNSSYLSELRDKAKEEWKVKVHLTLAKAKEAYVLQECEVKMLSSKSPKNSQEYERWRDTLNQATLKMKELKAEYDRLQKAWDAEDHMTGDDYRFFLHRYEEANYHPSEEDYTEVEVPERKGRSGLLVVGPQIIGDN